MPPLLRRGQGNRTVRIMWKIFQKKYIHTYKKPLKAKTERVLQSIVGTDVNVVVSFFLPLRIAPCPRAPLAGKKKSKPFFVCVCVCVCVNPMADERRLLGRPPADTSCRPVMGRKNLHIKLNVCCLCNANHRRPAREGYSFHIFTHRIFLLL